MVRPRREFPIVFALSEFSVRSGLRVRAAYPFGLICQGSFRVELERFVDDGKQQQFLECSYGIILMEVVVSDYTRIDVLEHGHVVSFHFNYFVYLII